MTKLVIMTKLGGAGTEQIVTGNVQILKYISENKIDFRHKQIQIRE